MKARRAILLTLGVALWGTPWAQPRADALRAPALEIGTAGPTTLQVVFHSDPQAFPQITAAPVPAADTDASVEDTLVTLRRIVGTEPASIGERLKAVHGLGPSLTRNPIAILTVFLKQPPPATESNLEGWRALKNDLLNVLRHQTSPPSGLTDLLIAMHRDPAQDRVLRDYALQHLVVWYEQGAPDSPDGRGKIRAVLQEAAQGNDSLAGTALLGLHRLSASDSEGEAPPINDLALNLVRSAATDPAARITAVAICAERGLVEALPDIATLADSTASEPLRLAATTALRRLGALARAHQNPSLAGQDNTPVASPVRLARQPMALKLQPD